MSHLHGSITRPRPVELSSFAAEDGREGGGVFPAALLGE